MTTEQRWISRLRRLLKDMPDKVELVAYEGRIAVCESGSLRRHLDTGNGWGTADYIDKLAHRRIHTHGESE